MSTWNVFRFLPALSASLALVSPLPNPQPPSLSRSELVGKINHVIRWKAFWEGMEAFKPKYVAGAHIDAKVVRTSQDIGVFIGAVRMNIVLRWHSQSGQFHPSFWSYTAGETSDDAAQRYIAAELKAPEDRNCVPILRAPSQGMRQNAGNVVPSKRVCRDQNGIELFSEEDVSLELPSLNTPLAASPSSSEANQLRRAATKALRYYVGRQCPTASVTIPRFSPDDPFVYVFVDFGQSCGRGVLAARRDRTGAWEAGKLFEDRPLNDLSRIIRQVQKGALEIFRLPLPG